MPHVRWLRAAVAGAVLGSMVVMGSVTDTNSASASSPVGSSTTGSTRGADAGRTGWYPDQTTLTPGLVSGGTFGQLFKTPVDGSVYGQPLLDDNQLLVTTENNVAYGLNPVSGGILWSRRFGSPVKAAVIGCADLVPNLGVTGTSVVDTATDTEYLVDNEYVSGTSGPAAFYMHALDLDHEGAERPGFPVLIHGTASNNPTQNFDPLLEIQRPGLLLLGNSVYAAFAGHCDEAPWQGWIAGVSEAGHLDTMWSAAAGSASSVGAGIWMSGGGLVSDGPGQILMTTGNGTTRGNSSIPGDTPPGDLGESVVRLVVQPDKSLRAVDFFSPYDEAALDRGDLDLGSGSPIALPDADFGTAAIPHLAVAVGKEGYVYLLDRDHLGGSGQGPHGTDDVVGRYGPNGGVWSSPAAWGGDGGWVYIPTASGSISAGGTSGVLDAYQYGVDGTGKPTLDLAGKSADAFGYGSSAPVVTSDGTAPGSALVWTVWSPSASGVGAQLRAYDPVPVGGVMHLRWSAPVGTASKFNPPGVGGDRLYVGTRDGSVIGFGAPVAAPVLAPPPSFPPTIVGQSSTQTVSITAQGPAIETVTSLAVSGTFSLGAPSLPLPASLAGGASMSVPVTFTPTEAGPAGGGMTITTASGSVQVTLTASGEEDGPSLVSTTSGVSFGGIPPSSQSSDTVGFANNGSSPVTLSGVVTPGSPFSVSGSPEPGTTLAPGAQVVVDVTFAPTVLGSYSDSLEIDSNGGNVVVLLTGASTAPSVLTVTPLSVDYGNVPVGQPTTRNFEVTNVGGSELVITKSKPPVLGPFAATTTLPEGTTIVAGASVVESVRFTPEAGGVTTDRWVITASDDQGPRTVTFTGNGFAANPPPVVTPGQPTVGMASTPDGGGYWTADAAGDVRAFGDADFEGSLSGRSLNRPVAHIVSTADGGGYWLVASDGGIFAFGDAAFHGSMGGQPLNAPVVDLAPTSDGGGYWLVASDGGVFSFGDAAFHGSMGGVSLNGPVVGIAGAAGGGYWLVASDGGIFAFGAPFDGSAGDLSLNEPVNGMAAAPDGGGYWLVASDGGVFCYGSAGFEGSAGGMALVGPVVGMAPDPATTGYWLVASDGGIFAFGAPFFGSGSVA